MSAIAKHDALLLDKQGRPRWMYRSAPFRDAFLASDLSANEVARRMGLPKNAGPYVTRMLGIRPAPLSGGRRINVRAPVEEKRISYDNAVKIVRALNLHPFDFGV